MYYKVGFFFCKVDKFLPHIFLGAYKMATKMTLTYVKMTCFFHENIFFFLSFKNKAFKTHARLRSWCKHARTFKLRKCKDRIMCIEVNIQIKYCTSGSNSSRMQIKCIFLSMKSISMASFTLSQYLLFTYYMIRPQILSQLQLHLQMC